MEPTKEALLLAQARNAVRVAAQDLEEALNRLPTDQAGRPIEVQLRLDVPELMEIRELTQKHARYVISRGFGVHVTFHHTERIYP